MWEELKSKAKLEFMHIVCMTRVSMGENDPSLDWDTFTPEVFSIFADPTPEHIRRLTTFINLMDKFDLL